MKQLILFILFFLTLATFYILLHPATVTRNPLSKVAPPEIKRAIWRMGPQKTYRILPSGELQVKVKGRWLRLRYERKLH